MNVSEVDLSTIALQRVRRLAKTVQHVSFHLDVADECLVRVDKILIEELLYIILQ